MDSGVFRLELLVSDVERLSLVGRLSGGFDRCDHKSHGGPLPTSPLQPQVPGTQRGLPVPSGADTDIPLVGAGPGGPSKHATTPPIWGLPGALGASAPPQSTAARRPRVFYWGEARGLMPGGRGPQTPRRPSVIRLFSSAATSHQPPRPHHPSLSPRGGVGGSVSYVEMYLFWGVWL